jgi:hypothetical protein
MIVVILASMARSSDFAVARPLPSCQCRHRLEVFVGQILNVAIVAEDTTAELGSLFRWLQQDDDLRHTTVLRHSQQIARGEMGAVTDYLQVALQPGGVAVAVVTAALTWLSTRSRKIRVRFRHGEREVEIEASNLRT